MRRRDGVAVAVLAPIAVMVAAAVFLWLESAEQSLQGDEWGYAIRLSSQSLGDALVDLPPEKHVIALPLLVYHFLFESFGIESYTPIRVAWVAALLLCGGLFFIFMRRRVDLPLALMAMALLLLLGSSWEVVATPMRFPSLVAIAAGLGALLMLERRDRAGDAAASALLVISLLSHSTALAFLAAAAGLIWTRSGRARRAAAWVVGLPAVAYAVWWLSVRDPSGDDPGLAELIELPLFVAGSAASDVGAVTGVLSVAWLQRGLLDEPLRLASVVVPAVIVAALLIWALRERWRLPQPLPVALWAALAALAVFWLATGIAPGPDRVPWAARYLFPAAIFLLWAFAELARGVTPSRHAWMALAGVFTFAFAANVAQLDRAAGDAENDSEKIRAELGALEVARDSVDPDLHPDDETGRDLVGELGIPALNAGDYFGVADAYGTTALRPADIASSDAAVQRAADITLARASAPRLLPLPSADARGVETARSSRKPLRVVSREGARVTPHRGCLVVEPIDGSGFFVVVELPRGSATLTAGNGPDVALGLSRWGAAGTYSLQEMEGGTAARLSLANHPEIPSPWKLSVRATQRVRVCPGRSARR